MKISYLKGCLGAILVASSGLAGAATEMLAAGTGSAQAELMVPQFLAQPPALTAEQALRQQQFAARQRGAGALGAANAVFASPRADTQTRADIRPAVVDRGDPAYSPRACLTSMSFHTPTRASTSGTPETGTQAAPPTPATRGTSSIPMQTSLISAATRT